MTSNDSALVGWFADLSLADRPQVGGKGGSLGELARAGIDVPPGFVVKTAAFEGFLAFAEREAPLRALVEGIDPDDLSGVAALSRRLRARIESAPLPRELADAIGRAYDKLNATHHGAVAVRSSATTEDAVDASFAGLQDTYLWVPSLAETLDRVRSCWGSLYSVESITYRRRHGFAERDVAMAVVVQTMVDARTAGVMFTRSPLTGDRSVMAIEGSWGLGSAVVGGEVTPDRWVVGKITGEISVREISDKQICHVPMEAGGTRSVAVEESRRQAPCMSDAELDALRLIGRRVERHYGRPQDIEWAVDRHTGAILLLQSRPETVWSSREAAPTATPVTDPSLHVLKIFGGLNR
ncbi:MAG TPA: PEP/pyruvate-binding domain-containing protein [Steroidobacteraceae bacterium]|nr:PEP/pyruvate-binding domain-containing protein [Steroidobacteraceae bacterium]